MSATNKAGMNMRFEEADMLNGILVEYASRLAHEIQLTDDTNTEEYQRKVKRLLLIKQQLKELSKEFPDLILPSFARTGLGHKQLTPTHAHTVPYNEPYITVEPMEGSEFVVRRVPAGVHVAATYEEGFITQLLTRGTGLEGEDILATNYRIPSLPLRLPTMANYQVVVQGIVGISPGNYGALETPRPSVRNYIAGLLRNPKIDPEGINKLTFIAIDVFTSNLQIDTYLQGQEFLKSMGFVVSQPIEETPAYMTDGVSYTLNQLKEKHRDMDSSTVVRYLLH